MPLDLGLLRLIGNIALHAATAIALLTLALHARVAWWRTEMGRHLMTYQVVVAAMLMLFCVNVDFLSDQLLWFAIARAAIYIGAAVVLAQRAWLHYRAQHAKR